MLDNLVAFLQCYTKPKNNNNIGHYADNKFGSQTYIINLARYLSIYCSRVNI